MKEDVRARGGVAMAALGAILAITAAWWALALWPLPSGVPSWIERTRAICFGASREGLPNAGGWILLVGEPLGMLGVLMAVWGRAVRRDARRLVGSAVGRTAAALVTVGCVAGLLAAAQRVRTASAAPMLVESAAPAVALDLAPSDVTWIDQLGGMLQLGVPHGAPVLVTFAFGGCETVCPLSVHRLLSTRTATGRRDVAIYVITLDPWRDTPSRLATIAAQWGLGDGDRLLGGSIDDVNRGLDDLGIGRSRDPQTGDITHPVTTLVIGRTGRIEQRLDGNARGLGDLIARL